MVPIAFADMASALVKTLSGLSVTLFSFYSFRKTFQLKATDQYYYRLIRIIQDIR